MVAILMTFIVGMVAFAVDVGWMCTVRAHAQTAADSAAMAGVGDINKGLTIARTTAVTAGNWNTAGGQAVQVNPNNVEFGLWDSATRTFNTNSSIKNACRVTLTADAPLSFARIFGWHNRAISAEAIAVSRPRDIAFVIDLSGSMNNDSEIWSVTPINNAYPDFPGIGTQLLQDIFNDFGFGSYPGLVQHIGQNVGVPSNQLTDAAYGYLINTHLLTLPATSENAPYRILSSDSAAVRKTKAYRWLIDKQLAAIMPLATPAPNSSNTTSFNYWSTYLDYIIHGSPTAPANQASQRISGSMGNPYTDAWPNLSSSIMNQFRNKVGYQTYVQFMMDWGRNRTAGGIHVPLSVNSPLCPLKEDTDPTSPNFRMRFPPREQPTHAARLAIMAAIDKIAQINAGLDEAYKDHVCLITFDTVSGTTIHFPLNAGSCDYNAVKNACLSLQAVADDQASTASETGLIVARNHLDPNLNPGGARLSADKIFIFLSDGIPNLKTSADSVISNYTVNNPGEWFTSGSMMMHRNAVLMQTDQIRKLGWKVHAVGVGLGTDRTLMDRIARMAGTGIPDPSNPNGPKISAFAEGNPADYRQRMTAIFDNIVAMPNITLVR